VLYEQHMEVELRVQPDMYKMLVHVQNVGTCTKCWYMYIMLVQYIMLVHVHNVD